MKPTLVFPMLLIAMNLGAALLYACDGNIRLAVYWTAAAILTVTVTL
jgi:uncharacterized membrane protein